MAVFAGFLLGIRVGLALGHRNAKKEQARAKERARARKSAPASER